MSNAKYVVSLQYMCNTDSLHNSDSHKIGFPYQGVNETSMPSNIHITSAIIIRAKCSHSFGAPLAKVLLTFDHLLDYAEQTKEQNPEV